LAEQNAGTISNLRRLLSEREAAVASPTLDVTSGDGCALLPTNELEVGSYAALTEARCAEQWREYERLLVEHAKLDDSPNTQPFTSDVDPPVDASFADQWREELVTQQNGAEASAELADTLDARCAQQWREHEQLLALYEGEDEVFEKEGEISLSDYVHLDAVFGRATARQLRRAWRIWRKVAHPIERGGGQSLFPPAALRAIHEMNMLLWVRRTRFVNRAWRKWVVAAKSRVVATGPPLSPLQRWQQVEHGKAFQAAKIATRIAAWRSHAALQSQARAFYKWTWHGALPFPPTPYTTGRGRGTGRIGLVEGAVHNLSERLENAN